MLPLLLSIVTDNPSVIGRRLAELSRTVADKDVFLFCLSAPPSSPVTLERLVNQLSTFGESSNVRRLGCLSAPPSYRPNAFSCSIGLFRHGSATPFRSTLPGPLPPRVGRWHAFKQTSDYENEFTSSNYGIDVFRKDPQLPSGLGSSTIGSCIYFSDLAPQGLVKSLQHSFPGALQLGLMASSTPFITGRPVTLFDDRKIYSDGAIGIALPPITTSSAHVSNDAMRVLQHSSPMTVTKSEGNIVIELNNQNPTSLLLKCLEDTGEVLSPLGAVSSRDVLFAIQTMTKSPRYFRITAGDPSRGPISLDENSDAPAPGEQVMFCYQRTSPATLSSTQPDDEHTFPQTISFSALDDTRPSLDTADNWFPGFKASSENGFSLVEPGLKAWRCNIPGTAARFTFLNHPLQGEIVLLTKSISCRIPSTESSSTLIGDPVETGGTLTQHRANAAES